MNTLRPTRDSASPWSPSLLFSWKNWTSLTVLFFAAVLAVFFYRAATQSITHDEALSYKFYVKKSILLWFRRYDANNHFLNSFGERVFVPLFGESPLSLRLSAVLGGALCMGGVFYLLRRAVGNSFWLPLGFLLVFANPATMDYFCAARGYGLALGFSALSLALACWALDTGVTRAKLCWLSLCLALVIYSNLAFAVFALSVALSFLCMAYRLEKEENRSAAARRVLRMAFELASPAAIFLTVCMVPFLLKARPKHFYIGFEQLDVAVLSYWEAVFAHKTYYPGVYWSGGSFFFGPWFVLLAVALGFAATVFGFVRAHAKFRAPEADETGRVRTVFLMCASSVLLALLAYAVLHQLVGLRWPAVRTGIYLVVFGSLGLALMPALLLGPEKRSSWSGLLAAVPLFVCLCLFLGKFQVRSFFDWDYDAGTDAALQAIVETSKREGLTSVSVGGQWLYEPSVNFIRSWRQLNFIPEYKREDDPFLKNYDFVLVNTTYDYVDLKRLGLRSIFYDPESGTNVCRAVGKGK